MRNAFVGAVNIVLLAATTATLIAAPHDQAHALIVQCDVAGLQRLVAKEPAVVKSVSSDGMPLLVRAAMTTCVSGVGFLLASGANVQVSDKVGRTPLHAAAGWSNLLMVQELVKAGAKLNARTSHGDTPLSFAGENFLNDGKAERNKITAFLVKQGAK